MTDFKAVISVCLSFPFVYYKTKKVLGKSKLFSISSNMICLGDELTNFSNFLEKKGQDSCGMAQGFEKMVWNLVGNVLTQ